MMSLFVFLILLAIVALVFATRKTFPLGALFIMSRKFHLIVLFSFIGILFSMAIFSEIFYPHSEEFELPPRVDGNNPKTFQQYNAISDNIVDGNSPDSPLLVASRTHEADGQLEIVYSGEHDDFPIIYIERKKTKSNTIEEYVYKPFMFINDYDYTEQVSLHLPVWDHDTITISNMVDFQLNMVQYMEASIFKQFLNERSQPFVRNGFGSSYSSPIIYLIVPEDLDIIDPFNDVNFVDELRNTTF